MDAADQKSIWAGRATAATAASVVESYRYPCAFQVEFSEYLNALGRQSGRGRLKVCEMGSEFGVTSLLLSEKLFERHAVDFNPEPLKLLAEAAKQLGQEMFTHTQDMFCTEWADASFDIVFNNGVLEHYDSKQRAAALAEAARLTRHGGLVIVGVPNHCSLPYRSAYLLRRALGKWHYPPEEKIRDFGKELAEVRSLRQRQLLFFDQETIFRILPRHQLTALPFRWLHGVCKFEPYLRVFELERVAV